MRTAAEQTAQVSQVTNPGKIGTEDLKVKGNASENVAVKQETIQAENVPANAPKTGNTQTDAREEIAEKTEAKKDGKGETGKSSDAGKTASEEKSSVEQIREKMTEEEKVRAGKNSARMKQLRERMVRTKQEIAQLEDPKAKRTMSETARENRLAKLRKQLETDQARYNTLTRENERIGKRAETGKAQAEPTSKTEQAKAEKRADFEEEYSSREEAKADPGNNADERLTKISDTAWRDGQTYLKTFDRLSWDRKRAVCATIQSAKDAGVTSKLVISASAKLASIRSGLEIRFSDKVASSSWTKIDPEHGERLVLVSTKSADQIVIRTELVHEMIHDLRYTNSAAYAKIKKAAFGLTTDERAAEIYDQYTGHFNEKNLSDYLKENNLERTEENIDRYFEKYDGISRENVEEEITAKCIMNDARVNRLFDRLGDRSTWRKFLDVVSDFREVISERFSGKGEDEQLLVRQSGSIEKTILQALGADYAAERVMRNYGYDGKEAYGERTEAKEKTRGEVKYSIPYEDAIDELDRDSLDITQNTHLKISDHTPQIYIEKAGASDFEIVMSWDVAYLAMKKNGEISGNYHGLGADIMKALPLALENPLYIVKQKNGRIAAVTQIVVKGKRAVFASIELEAFKTTIQEGKTESKKYNLVVTVTDAKPNYLQNTIFSGNVVYNKNGEDPAHFILRLKSLDKALPTYDRAESSTDSISQKSEKSTEIQKKNLPDAKATDRAYLDAVKRGDTETAERMVREAAKNAMPDTKIVDEDGNPMVMYHRTSERNGLFYEFDSTKAVKKGGHGFQSLGRGNYFMEKSALESTEGYGNRIISAYLDIQNPFVSNGGNGFLKEVSEKLGINNQTFYGVQQKMREMGYDGVILNSDNGKIGIAVTFDSNQIKSADTVTYDDSGNVIPLSERFNEKKTDIRYNLSETSDTDKDAKIAELTEELSEARKGEEQAKKEAENANKRAKHSEKEAKHKMQAAYDCVKVVDEIKKMSEAMRGNTQIVRDEVSTQVIKLAEKIGRNAKNPFKESSSEVFDLFAAVKRFMVDEDAANPGMMAEQNGEWSFADRFSPRAKAIIEELAAQAGSKKILKEGDLWNVRSGLFALKKAIRDADKVVINERKESLSRTAAEGVRNIEEVASFRAKDENANPLFRVARTISDAVRKKYFYQVMTPIAVIDSLEGYSNGPLTRIYKAFTRAKQGCDRWHDYEMNVNAFDENQPIYYEFTACPAAEFAKKHGLEAIMPTLSNVDYKTMELIHVKLLCTSTCVKGTKYDYTICGDRDEYITKHPEYRDAAGFRRNR